jgi:hypothetical protein
LLVGGRALLGMRLAVVVEDRECCLRTRWSWWVEEKLGVMARMVLELGLLDLVARRDMELERLLWWHCSLGWLLRTRRFGESLLWPFEELWARR